MRRVQCPGRAVAPDIKNFTPGAPSVHKEFYQECPINVDVEGTYHNLGLFFDRVAASRASST